MDFAVFSHQQAACRRKNKTRRNHFLKPPIKLMVFFQKTKSTPIGVLFILEVPARFELANNGFADRGLTTWLRYHMKLGTRCVPNMFGAGDEARTRYLHLGKVALYRMSYTRINSADRRNRIPSIPTKSTTGASGRNRTNDTRIFSPLLYRLSYRGILWRAFALHRCFIWKSDRSHVVL